MNMNPMLQQVMQSALSNPDIQKSQMGMQFMNIMRTGNVSAGEAMANDILQKIGLSKEQAYQQAVNGLTNMFQGRR